jgi:hypothetical protein
MMEIMIGSNSLLFNNKNSIIIRLAFFQIGKPVPATEKHNDYEFYTNYNDIALNKTYKLIDFIMRNNSFIVNTEIILKNISSFA